MYLKSKFAYHLAGFSLLVPPNAMGKLLSEICLKICFWPFSCGFKKLTLDVTLLGMRGFKMFHGIRNQVGALQRTMVSNSCGYTFSKAAMAPASRRLCSKLKDAIENPSKSQMRTVLVRRPVVRVT